MAQKKRDCWWTYWLIIYTVNNMFNIPYGAQRELDARLQLLVAETENTRDMNGFFFRLEDFFGFYWRNQKKRLCNLVTRVTL